MRKLAALTVLSLAVPACVDAPVADNDDKTGLIGMTEQAIQSEIPGRAEIMGRFRMDDPRRLRASYMTVRDVVSNAACSATMIGPNILMTAAHCGDSAHTVTFFVYNGGPNEADPHTLRDNFRCTPLVNTFPETDLVLAYCDDNAAGESPGIKYGYADFDLVFRGKQYDFTASKARVTSGTSVYSVWNNVVTDVNHLHMLYSPGTLDVIDNAGGWFRPSALLASDPNLGQCDSTQPELNVAVLAKVFGASGCSGSALFSAASHKIIAGPTTLAPPGNGGTPREMLPIVEYLERAVVQTPDAPACGTGPIMVNGEFIADRWNLTSANFRGRVDVDRTGVFDIQEAIERVEGEPQRSSYKLAFGSSRQNQLWDADSLLSTERRELYAPATFTPFWSRFARHTRLNVKPNTQYHVTFRASSSTDHMVCLGGGCVQAAATVQFPASPVYVWRAGVVNSGTSGALEVWGYAGGDTHVTDITIVEMGSTNGFSTMDERDMWSGAEFPTIVPLGVHSESRADFAAVLGKNTTGLFNGLANAHLPFKPGPARVCFDVKNNPLQPVQSATLTLRTYDNTWLLATSEFAISPATVSAWSTLCSQPFTMSSYLGEIKFALSAPGTLLIDNVRVESLDAGGDGDGDGHGDGDLGDGGI